MIEVLTWARETGWGVEGVGDDSGVGASAESLIVRILGVFISYSIRHNIQSFRKVWISLFL